MVWFYEWPTPFSFILFVLLIVAAALIGLYLFQLTSLYKNSCGEHNTIIGIFAGTVATFLGIILSFVIITVWDNYTQAELNAQKESQAIYLLYGVLQLLPGTESTQQLIVSYLENIINLEYPEMKKGSFPTGGVSYLNLLRQAVYGYVPQTDQQVVLYNEAIDWLNEVITLRIDRYNAAFRGVYPVVWWVSIIDSILIILISYFVNCPGIVHYILMFIIGIYVSTALFLVLILSSPFEGYLGITSLPFQIVLAQITNPNNEVDPGEII